MTIRTLVLHPDPRLKKRCEPVSAVTDELRQLADDMLETMYDAPGVGLAAPQVGQLVRLFVMDCSGKDEDPDPIILFNPEITWSSEDMNIHEEGCLSIPENFADVSRPAEVKVRYLDKDGEAQERHFKELQATCAQHEIDHLNGVLFIDHLSSLKRQMITRKMLKFKKELARRSQDDL